MYNIQMTCDAWLVGSESTVLAVTYLHATLPRAWRAYIWKMSLTLFTKLQNTHLVFHNKVLNTMVSSLVSDMAFILRVKWGCGPNNLNVKTQFDITLLPESVWKYCTDKQMQCCATNYRIVQTRISVGELTKQHMWWSFSGGKTATSIDFLGFPHY